LLTELSVRDIALISELNLRFGPGLHVLSGETGAGKSLVVGGLRLLCGERAGPDVVRSGRDRGVVEGVFEVAPDGWIARRLAALGIEPEDGEVIVRREVSASGRGRVRINGAAVPLRTLARASDWLIDLHGQHDHQSLLHPAFQLEVLDGHAGLLDERAAFGATLTRWKEAAAERDRLETELREAGARRELARFQLAELETASPGRGELSEAKAEMKRLESAEWLQATAGRLVELLADGDASIGDLAGDAAHDAARAAERDEAWRAVSVGLESLSITARELGSDVRALGERTVHDPERLEALRERVRHLEDLLRKYGPGEDELFAAWERLREEGADPQVFERRLAEARESARALEEEMLRAGEGLTRRRRKAAVRLRRALQETLADLGMAGTAFEARLEPRRAGTPVGDDGERRAGASGLDQVEFHLAVNAGEELRPLRAVASGGEISRVMLGLKSVLGESRGTATMVFDEIDAGIGGRVAGRVADRLSALARTRQVICITHLAAIASRARVHLHVRKEESGGRTVSVVEPVEGEGRVLEVARMLGGDEEGVAVDHARKLLESASG
jgi:DNA repair protein RecN (Recombination protein N)